jgi:hypothetical protein
MGDASSSSDARIYVFQFNLSLSLYIYIVLSFYILAYISIATFLLFSKMHFLLNLLVPVKLGGGKLPIVYIIETC